MGVGEIGSGIERAHGVATIRLREGSVELPVGAHALTVKVSADTELRVEVEGVVADRPSLSRASLALGTAIFLHHAVHPLLALSGAGLFLRLFARVFDWLFAVRIERLELVGPKIRGAVHVVCAGIALRVPQRALRRLATRPDAASGAGALGALDVGGVLERLRELTGTMTWSAHVDGDEITLGKRWDAVDLAWKVPAAALKLHGDLTITEQGRLRISIQGGDRAPPPRSATAQAQTEPSIAGSVTVEMAGKDLAIDGDVALSLPLAGGVVTLKPGPGIALPLELRGSECALSVKSRWALRGRQVAAAAAELTLEVKAFLDDKHDLQIGPATLKTKGGRASLATSGTIDFSKGVLRVDRGKLEASVGTDQLDLLYRRFNARVDGAARLDLVLEGLAFDSATRTLAGGGRTVAQLGSPPSDATEKSVFPFLRPSAEVRLSPSGRLAIEPHRPSPAELLSDLFELSPNAHKIVPTRTPRSGASASPELKQRVSTLCKTQLRAGNRVTPLIDGKRSRPARNKLIAEAQTSLCLQALIFKDDLTGRETIDGLIAAQKRGVAVRVIVDAAGNIETVGDIVDGKPFYRELIAAGVELRLYNDPRDSWLGKLVPLLRELPNIPELPLEDLPKILKDPARLLRLLNRLVRMSNDRHDTDPAQRARIKPVIERLLTGDEHSDAWAQLATITADNVLSASELFTLLKLSRGLNHRWHEKYLVADGRAVVMGGMNVADEYLLGGTEANITVLKLTRPAWRDMDVLIEGPAAADAFASFARNWQELARRTGTKEPAISCGPPAAAVGDVEVQILQHRPLEDGDHAIGNFMIEQLKALNAGDRAWIANAYFLPTGALTAYKHALIDAARSGVDVRVVTNSASTSDLPNINKVAVFPYRELLEAGVRVFERDGESTQFRTMHTKAAVFGRQTVALGSWNADNRSESLNSEALAVIYDAALADTYAAAIRADMAPGQAVELKLPAAGASPVARELDAYLQSVLSNLM